MKLFYEKFWYFFVVIMFTAILDLIALPTKANIGAGFIFGFLSLIAFVAWNMFGKKTK